MKNYTQELVSNKYMYKFIFPIAQQPLVGQGLLIIEASRSHSDTQHSVGLLWTSDQPDARPTPDNTQHSQATDIYARGGIRTRNPSKRAATDSRLRRRGHWDRPNMFKYWRHMSVVITYKNCIIYSVRLEELTAPRIKTMAFCSITPWKRLNIAGSGSSRTFASIYQAICRQLAKQSSEKMFRNKTCRGKCTETNFVAIN
jgi:hypothetical protein